VYVDHDLAGTRYSPLKQITTENVSQLVKACAYSFPDKEPSQTAPIVSAGRMYLTTAHYTVALDAKDGHTLWAKQIADPKEGYFISMPPLVHGDLIYIGPAGALSIDNRSAKG